MLIVGGSNNGDAVIVNKALATSGDPDTAFAATGRQIVSAGLHFPLGFYPSAASETSRKLSVIRNIGCPDTLPFGHVCGLLTR